LTCSVIAALLLFGCATDDATTARAPAKASDLADGNAAALAEKAIEQKQYEDAKSLIQRILLRDGSNKHAQVLWGELLLATGAANAAMKYFDASNDDPALGARALQGKGLALIWMGQIEQAKNELEKAIEQNPMLWRAWNALGYCYDAAGAWTLASHAYEKAISLNGKSPALFNNRGYSRLLQRRLEEATDDFATALRLDPRLMIARVNLRLAMAWSGQYERAVLGSERKELHHVLNNVGFVAMLRGDLVAAEGLLLRAVEADAAYNRTAHKNLSYLRSIRLLGKEDKNDKK
jgi:Flp pilus assembly protein TadD